MARTTFVCKCRSIAHAESVIPQILTAEGYSQILENGETVWKCGNGAWVSMKYIKIEFADDTTAHITGWVKSTIGPEQNLDGVIGGLPKKQALKVIDRLRGAIL